MEDIVEETLRISAIVRTLISLLEMPCVADCVRLDRLATKEATADGPSSVASRNSSSMRKNLRCRSSSKVDVEAILRLKLALKTGYVVVKMKVAAAENSWTSIWL